MFAPETRVFMGKLVKAFLLVGTIVALAVAAILQGANAIGKPGQALPPVEPHSANAAPNATRTQDSQREVQGIATEASAQAAVDRARNEPDPGTRRGLWSAASRQWSMVVAKGDPVVLNAKAVASFLYAADDLWHQGKEDEAAEAVYEAEGFAGSDPELSLKVQEWKTALNR